MIAHHQIIQEVALHFDVSEFQITSKSEATLFARLCVAYLCVELTDSSYTAIAKSLGYNDHRSIQSAHTNFKNELVGNVDLTRIVKQLKTSMEFKSRLISSSNIDIYELAKSIAKQPQRKSINVSVNQISALAMGYLEMRDVALAGEHLSLKTKMWFEANEEELTKLSHEEDQSFLEISRSIIETMAHMSGTQNGETNAN